MDAVQFEKFVKGMVKEMGPQLLPIGKEFVAESGRGAIALRFHDSPNPAERRMGIDYLKAARLPNHRYLKQLVLEYDPDQDVVIYATKDGVEAVVHLQFGKSRV